ncbi:MAG: PP0621 family protein [Comamonas sp.]|jgi:uncharacterized protein|nr:hypothetical protein [Comamonas sp.]
MSKYLLILAIIAVIYAAARGQRKTPTRTARGKPATRPPQNMVACARCGVHLPESDALREGKHHYCCAAHRDQGPA